MDISYEILSFIRDFYIYVVIYWMIFFGIIIPFLLFTETGNKISSKIFGRWKEDINEYRE